MRKQSFVHVSEFLCHVSTFNIYFFSSFFSFFFFNPDSFKNKNKKDNKQKIHSGTRIKFVTLTIVFLAVLWSSNYNLYCDWQH